MDDKNCYSFSSGVENPTADSYSFEFQNGGMAKKNQQQRKALGSRGKPPSKWDDAQKWLVGLSSGGNGHNYSKTKPRNSNADDRRLLHSLSQRARDSCSSADGVLEDDVVLAIMAHEEGETKKIDCNEALWRSNKPNGDSPVAVKSICLRDMGTEMTPIASNEPSRTGTPLRATTPVLRSPISSRTSSPGRCRQGALNHELGVRNLDRGNEATGFGKTAENGWTNRGDDEINSKALEMNDSEHVKKPDPLESRAMAWDEAERAKYMARFKREEVKIQAWENHERRKAEMEMKRMELKAERLKSRAQEKLANKLAATRRIAEEKRANAEAKLNECAARTSERADYIRRTGHLPALFFSLKLPSLCG